MSLSRRTILKCGLGAGAAILCDRLPAFAAPHAALITKPIPSSGERIPVIGLGSAGTFDLARGHLEYDVGRDVIRLFHQLGGRVIDTAPTYQRSELFIGETARSLDIQHELFLATKVNVGAAGGAAARQQMENSSQVFGKRVIDLMQVWNLGDSIRNLTDAYLDAHMETVLAWKAAGRCRYIGITTSRDPQYADVETAMRRFRIDFVQLDYSIGDRLPEQRLLPLAQERGIAVIANRPFTTGSLFRLVAGKSLPSWSAAADIDSWAQFFLTFVVSHPAVTCAIPATGDTAHLRDNMGACSGALPDAAMRRRMAAFFDA
ncbi:MAG TPA: aldo/keto reductase, partial [Longimicrobiales bacterium]|nr:aldo/keto reductase [Longimicrobiales bacterium]